MKPGLRPSLVLALLPCLGLVLPACGSGASGTFTLPAKSIGAGAAQDGATCPDPSQVLAGVAYACTDGSVRQGTLTQFDGAVCQSDGEVGCLTTTTYRAAETTGLASKVVSTATVAGVAGTYTPDFPDVANVRSSDTVNGANGTLADCTVLGRTDCYAGLSWTALENADLTAGNVRSGVTVGGVTGGYPSASHPLAGADTTTDLTSLAATTAAGSYEFFDSAGARYTGTISDAGTISIGTASQNFNTSLYRAFTVPGDADLVATNIRDAVSVFGVVGSAPSRPSDCSTDGAADCVVAASTTYRAAETTGLASKVVSTATVAGVAGTYTPDFPDVANVRSSDTVNGANGTLADCSTDGATNCTIPTSGTIKAADTAQFTGWDIRKKRNQSTGSVLTFAGLQGQSKTCRNRSRTGHYDNSTSPAISGLDFFDTIDDFNNNSNHSGVRADFGIGTLA